MQMKRLFLLLYFIFANIQQIQPHDFSQHDCSLAMPSTRSAKLLSAMMGECSTMTLKGGFEKDFKTVILNKKPPPRPANVSHTGKLARADDEIGPIPTVPHELRVAIMKARQAKNMTQKDLAKQLNEQVQAISWYESGREVPTNALIAKMERILGTKLPRVKPQKDKPKEGP